VNVEDQLRTAIEDVMGQIEPRERSWDFVERRRQRRQRRRVTLLASSITVVVLAVGAAVAARDDRSTVRAAGPGPDSLPDTPPPLTGRISGILVDDPRCNTPLCPLTRAAEMNLASLGVTSPVSDHRVLDTAPAPQGDLYVHVDLDESSPGTAIARMSSDGQVEPISAGDVASSTIGVSRSGKVAWVEADDSEHSLMVFDPATERTVAWLRGDARLASPAFGPGDSIAVLRTTSDDPFAFQHDAELVVVGVEGETRTVSLPDDLPFGFETSEPRISWGPRGLVAIAPAPGVDEAFRRTVVVDVHDGTYVAGFDGWFGQAWAPDGTGLLLFRTQPFDDGSDDTTVSSTDGAVAIFGTLDATTDPPPPGPRGTTAIAIAYGRSLSMVDDVGVVDHFFAGTHWVADAPSPGQDGDAAHDQSTTGDLDGDGRADRFLVSGRGPFTMRAELANGEVVESEVADEFRLHPIGSADINGDGRDEVFVETGGNTQSMGQIVVLDGGSLGLAATPDGMTPLAWGAHSNCCWRATSDVACLVMDGRPALVVTRSEVRPEGMAADDPGPTPLVIASMPSASLEHVWERTVWVLDGAALVHVLSDEGRFPADGDPPENVPLDNELRCGDIVA